MRPQQLTYASLIEMEEKRVAADRDNVRTFANRTSALREFMRRRHFNAADLIGREMRADFDEHLREFAKHLADGRVPHRSVTNRLSELRFWRKLVVQWDSDTAVERDQPPPFTGALRQLIGDRPIATVARQAGVPVDMLRGWAKGKLPRKKKCIPSLHRLEVFYSVPRGTLTSLIPNYRRGPAPGTGEAPVIAYRQRLGKVTQEQYFLRPGPTSPLRQQWEQFVRYKTAVRPSGLRRTQRGIWRVSPAVLHELKPSTWASFVDGKEVPTAGATWSQIASYLGWLGLDVERGGKGYSHEELQTLAWLAVPDHIEEFLRWKQGRAEGAVSGNFFAFIATITSLVRPEVGYLAQQAELLKTLPARFHGSSWGELCRQQFELCEALRQHFAKERTVWRNPFEPIAAVLQQPQPMEAVVDMVARLRADRPLAGGRMEAVWARDMVLIKLLISNPLRRRNLAQLTWRVDNTGNLYQRDDGSWWIRIEGRFFKNAAGAAGKQTYDTPVLEAAWTDIERYLRHYRPMLMREPTDLLLLSAGSREKGAHKPWKDLNVRVADLTKRYLWKCPGVGSHAFRHLVATSVLKATGNDYKTAALLLNDKAATVEKHYGHITSGDAAAKMAQALANSLSRLWCGFQRSWTPVSG